MRVLSTARVLFTLLAFQLAVGLQIGVAQAGAAATPQAASADAASALARRATTASAAVAMKTGAPVMHSSAAEDDCPMHSQPGTKPSAPGPADKHDCCKSNGCQCACGNLPLAFNVPAVRGTPAATLVQPTPAALFASAPAESHFRPPIFV